jgi:drug/metabolite transporter (DMT)-like permease/ubiquinone/menaquinone biosynthesis C-methylase UbiE
MESRAPSADPRLVVLAGVLFTSFSSILVRLSRAPALAIAAWRMGLSVLLTLPLLVRELASNRPLPGFRDLLLCLASGAFLALHFATWISSISMTSIASATVLVDTHPIFVVAVGFLILKERVSIKALLFLAVALAGSVLLCLGDLRGAPGAFQGDMLALAGAVSVSGYMLIGRIVRPRISVVLYTSIVYTTSAVLLSILAASMRIALFPYPLREIFIFLALALFCTMLGHSLFNWALKFLKASFVSTAILGEPVFATALAFLIFRQVPALTTLLGGTLVLAGLFLFVREEGRGAADRGPYDRPGRWYDMMSGPEWKHRTAGLRALAVAAGERVLEIGPGTGGCLVEFARAVGESGRVVGIDASQGMLEAAGRRLRRAGLADRVELIRADAASLPLPPVSFDAVFLSFTLELFEPEAMTAVLADCRRVLRDGGRLGVVSLSLEARSRTARIMVSLYGALHRRFPKVIDCRPIRTAETLREAGFALRHTSIGSMAGLPVEIVIVRKDNARG